VRATAGQEKKGASWKKKKELRDTTTLGERWRLMRNRVLRRRQSGSREGEPGSILEVKAITRRGGQHLDLGQSGRQKGVDRRH